MAQDKSDGTFKVIDRRLFNEEGELRPEASELARREHEDAKQAPGNAAPVATAVADTAAKISAIGETGIAGKDAGTSKEVGAGLDADVGPARSPHFEMLLNLIANQAASMLGAYADPRTGQAVVDLEGAREFIDMLDALREKTRGNLAAEEEATLTEVLGSLKFTFLEMTKAAAKAGPGGAGPVPGPRR